VIKGIAPGVLAVGGTCADAAALNATANSAIAALNNFDFTEKIPPVPIKGSLTAKAACESPL